jgi:alginate O-acetyltransferase complex protein AlgI
LSFASVAFLFYFLPATAAVFFVLGFSRQAQNVWLFFAGLAFCALGDPALALALLASVCVCTALGLLVERARLRGCGPRALAALACAFPLALLFFVRCLPGVWASGAGGGFPWAWEAAGAGLAGIGGAGAGLGFGAAGGAGLGFGAAGSAGLGLGMAGAVLPFMRPPFVAFFTLQALSYLLDVARGEAKAERNPVSVGLSVAFFPRLLAGPVLRHKDIAPRLRERRVTWEDFSGGVCRFAAGLGKTALIAYPLRQAADYAFQMSALHDGAGVSVALAWLGLAAYSLRLFHGFAGCSDMAVGLSRMFGFAAKENFDSPYAALSLTDFWRRWHISLSDWFRDYLWPLTGERAGAETDGGRAARRSLVVWLCVGLWHGAALTHVVWALWHFFWLTAERVTRLAGRSVPGPLRRLYVLLAVGIGWIFFRAPDMAGAFAYLRAAFGLSRNALADAAALMLLREYWPVFLAGALLSAPLATALGSPRTPRAVAVLRALAPAAIFFGGLLSVVRAGGAIWA